jgi:hypothetical protein
MTDQPKNPAERAQWKMHNFIENYGRGPEAIRRVATGVAPMYVEQGDAGNAAFLMSELRLIRGMFNAPYARLPVSRPEDGFPPEIDRHGYQVRELAARLANRPMTDLTGVYGYDVTPRVFSHDWYLNVTARTDKAYPPFRLTRVYRRLFVAGLV